LREPKRARATRDAGTDNGYVDAVRKPPDPKRPPLLLEPERSLDVAMLARSHHCPVDPVAFDDRPRQLQLDQRSRQLPRLDAARPRQLVGARGRVCETLENVGRGPAEPRRPLAVRRLQPEPIQHVLGRRQWNRALAQKTIRTGRERA